MRTYRQTGFDDAGEHASADRQDLVVEDVAGIVHRHRAVMADPEIGAGHHLHHVGEILAAHTGRRAREHIGRIDHGLRHGLDYPGLLFLVDQHAERIADVGGYFALEGRGNAGADRAHALADQRARAVVEGAHRAAELGVTRDYIV